MGGVARFPTITIAEEYGSGAASVADLLAVRLGVPVYDRDVLCRAAAEAGVPEETVAVAERGRGFVGRIVDNIACYAALTGPPLPADAAAALIAQYASSQLRTVVERVLQQIADTHPGVIVGHAAHMALRDRWDVVRVFLHAPLADRIRRIMVATGRTREQARRAAEASDRERAAFLRTWYHVNRHDLQLYDVTINTGGRTYDDVADEIYEVAERQAVRLSAWLS